MALMFSAREIIERDRGLTFDDVLLMPKHSTISSRRTPDLSAKLTKNFTLQTPIIAANMDTVSESAMMIAMAKIGAVAILHRFMEPAQQMEELRKARSGMEQNRVIGPLCASVGVKEEGMRRADLLADAGVQILTVDIAHGDSVMMLETLEYIKNKYPHIDVIAGNTATPDGVRRMIDAGADAVKVGIGPGSMCTTRIITGCGVPQLTAVAMCSQEAARFGIPVIADGGIKSSGDMVKAYAAGAQTVMLGSMLAGCLETPGEVHSGMKKYRGMASKDAQVSWRGDLPKGMAPEGESRMIACKGSVLDVVEELAGGIRSGMTYLNATTLTEIDQNAQFMEMTASGMNESKPHGMYK